jgi:hypothetical protein
MGRFDVFVEGAVDPSPDATRRLAEAMAQRYGLAVPELIARMAKGRFRVKGNIDQATADTYARDLEAIGARVTIAAARESGPSLAPVASVRPVEAEQPAPPRPSTSSLPPQTVSRPSASVLPPPVARATTPLPFASGLSAAFSDQQQPAADLGALGDDAFSLSSLDGSADPVDVAPASFAPPEQPEPPASSGITFKPSTKSAAPAKRSPPTAPPLDLFAPPDAEEAAFVVDLAVDDAQPRKRTTTPVSTRIPTPLPIPTTPVTPVTPVTPRRPSTNPSIAPTSGAPGVVLAGPPRWRFAAGVVVAIVLGFVPAHLVAAARETSAFRKIDEHVTEVQLQVGAPDAPVTYERLDGFRREQEDRKKTERRNIALTSMLIWAAAGALFAYIWFRRIPWDRR